MPGYRCAVLPLVGNDSSRYLCVECALLLKDAMLTGCGHFYCKSCIENLFRNPASVPICRKDGQVIEECRIIPDNNTRQEVLSFPVACEFCNEGCQWTGLVTNLEYHANECHFLRLPCKNSQCSMLVKRADMERHLTRECKYRLQDCPWCERKIPHVLMKTHLQEEHSGELRISEITNTQREQNVVPNVVGAVQDLERQVQELENRQKEYRVCQVELLRSRDEEKIEKDLFSDDIQKDFRKLERGLASIKLTLTKLNEDVQQQEFSSYDGVLLWKISDYARRRNDAVTGQQVSLYSPCFFTSRYGYKMCACLYLNGDGMGRGTHISLFFVIMRGQYDALLPWPFRQKVTFMLLDQDNVEHVIDAFRPDPSSSSFQRPRRETNIGSGCPMFCSLAELNNHAYVEDDTMFLKIIVDTSDL